LERETGERGMNAFNFLEQAPASLAARVAEVELTPAARRALLALLFAVAFLAVTAGVERLRLANALDVAQTEETRLRRSDESVRTLRASIETVAQLNAIARRVREVQSSGAGRAREIAEIGARLPHDVWLTSLSSDDAGVTLKGSAHDFAALGRAIARLSAAGAFGAPQLAGSRLRDSERADGSSIDFELRLPVRNR
jgi:Tfp pilus assembly protein PilN